MARLEVITGPMFSGKTDELIRRLTRHKIAGKEIRAYKPESDNRYSENEIAAHNGARFPATLVKKVGSWVDIQSDFFNTDVAGIDEAQFLDAAILSLFIGYGLRQDKTIIVAGLDMDVRGRPFSDGMMEAMAMADNVTKLAAVCQVCGEDATLTKKISGSNSLKIEVGGAEMYEARCREHWSE